MFLKILKVKIKSLVVTESNINYPGSISLPEDIIIASGLKPFELVYVNNKTNGNRITTYIVKNNIKGRVTINGAASKHFNAGDEIHVLAFAYLNAQEIEDFKPALVITNDLNMLVEVVPYNNG